MQNVKYGLLLSDFRKSRQEWKTLNLPILSVTSVYTIPGGSVLFQGH